MLGVRKYVIVILMILGVVLLIRPVWMNLIFKANKDAITDELLRLQSAKSVSTSSVGTRTIKMTRTSTSTTTSAAVCFGAHDARVYRAGDWAQPVDLNDGSLRLGTQTTSMSSTTTAVYIASDWAQPVDLDRASVRFGTHATGMSSTSTSTTTTFHAPLYSASDWAAFVEWKKYVPFAGDSLPRVLIYTWCTDDAFTTFGNEVYWKCCYAHLHGFDIVFSDAMNLSGVKEWHGAAGNLGKWYSEKNMWAWWSDIQNYLSSDKYDYVFMMGADVLINGDQFQWPVWAWDRGHDITVMDQLQFPLYWDYGLNENNILFRTTNLSKQFIDEALEFRKGFYLQADNGPYMETILRFVGRSVQSEGRMGYNDKCLPLMQLDRPSVMYLSDKSWANRNYDYSGCFFSELDRMAGGYGYRNAAGIGFHPTFVGLQGKAFYPSDFSGGQRPLLPPDHVHYSLILGPWANCWSSVLKYWPEPMNNCFAYHWNGPKDPCMHRFIEGGTCEDPTFNWDTSPYNPVKIQKKMMKKKYTESSLSNRIKHGSMSGSSGSSVERSAIKTTTTTTIVHEPFYYASDWAMFVEWKKRVSFCGHGLPRVLMYTWCKEEDFAIRVNEVYWKSCYAHLHGFDIVFSTAMNISGVKEWNGKAEKHIWAWWSDVQQYLFSGKYDYVFVMAEDVLINGMFFHWPLWAWDRGHDITVMDQLQFPLYWDYGLNQNDILFRSTNVSKQFIDEALEFRKGFYLQGDNGPYMETMLRFVGRSVQSEGRLGYKDTCLPLLQLDNPSFLHVRDKSWANRNYDYSKCFFLELDRMAGPWGYRKTKGIDFYPTALFVYSKELLPSDFSGGKIPLVPELIQVMHQGPLGPWANCWSSVRKYWTKPFANCFAFHFDEQDLCMPGAIEGGRCEDPTFNWDASPYNPANRE